MPAGTPSSFRSSSRPARQTEPLVDLEAAVEVRVVDQTLPADRGTRLFEVDAHHHHESVAEGLAYLDEAVGVFHRRDRIVHGAGPDDHQQAVVLAVQDALDVPTCVIDRFRGPVGDREFAMQVLRCDDLFDVADADVVCVVTHDLLASLMRRAGSAAGPGEIR